MGIFTPEFGTKHMCRDFNGILKWAKTRNKLRGLGIESPPKDRSLIVTGNDQYAHAHGHGKAHG